MEPLTTRRAMAPREQWRTPARPDENWESTVTAMLGSHIGHEADIVAEYRRFAEEAKDPAIRYLINLVAEDEDRHHHLFTDLVAAVVAAADSREATSPLPSLGSEPEPRQLREENRRFLAAEEDDARQLRALRRALRDVSDTTIWPLLIELVELDTQKHRRILQFIDRHCREVGS
jgi:rubrerythrin